MDCHNHRGVAAFQLCHICGKPFCAHCLVQIRDQLYCAACKMETVTLPPVVGEGTIPCDKAREALAYAVVGILCCAIIVEPIAIVKAVRAKAAIARNPRMAGNGLATAAIVIAVFRLVLTAALIHATIMGQLPPP